jgi:hypothetical protein
MGAKWGLDSVQRHRRFSARQNHCASTLVQQGLNDLFNALAAKLGVSSLDLLNAWQNQLVHHVFAGHHDLVA